MRTLVLGGYGNFGARICRALAREPAIELLVGGRDARRAEALIATLDSGARATAAPLDWHAPDLSAALGRLGVDLVIHAAGPFQDQPYTVARAAAQAGAHYIDLADGRRFVCDFPNAMHAPFLAANRTGISGASTVPALSSAVVEHLCKAWQRIDAIDTCIAPAQTAPLGVATLAAVLGYCGIPIRVWRDGQWQEDRCWAAPQRIEFARLRPRLGALCDIPDLELFPARYKVSECVMFRAALELGLAQRAFATLAALRTAGWARRPERWAHWLHRLAPLFNPLGSRLGGMVVRVTGLDGAGRPARRAWHIAADNDHGPEIPCMAAIVLARQLAHGTALPAGAFTAAGRVPLAGFTPEFERWGMQTDIVDELVDNAPVNAMAA